MPVSICKLTDISVLSNQNSSTKVTEKLHKYKDLYVEITRMCGMAEIMPVVIGVDVLFKKSTEHHLEKSMAWLASMSCKKITHLGTAYTKKVPAYSLNYWKELLIPQAQELDLLLEDYKNQFKRARTYIVLNHNHNHNDSIGSQINSNSNITQHKGLVKWVSFNEDLLQINPNLQYIVSLRGRR